MGDMKKAAKSYSYSVVLTPEPEGGFTVTVPLLPGCVTYGRDIAEARAMAVDAIRCHVGSLRKAREEAPIQDGEMLITSVAV